MRIRYRSYPPRLRVIKGNRIPIRERCIQPIQMHDKTAVFRDIHHGAKSIFIINPLSTSGRNGYFLHQITDRRLLTELPASYWILSREIRLNALFDFAPTLRVGLLLQETRYFLRAFLFRLIPKPGPVGMTILVPSISNRSSTNSSRRGLADRSNSIRDSSGFREVG